jgi:hypothetical protein
MDWFLTGASRARRQQLSSLPSGAGIVGWHLPPGPGLPISCWGPCGGSPPPQGGCLGLLPNCGARRVGWCVWAVARAGGVNRMHAAGGAGGRLCAAALVSKLVALCAATPSSLCVRRAAGARVRPPEPSLGSSVPCSAAAGQGLACRRRSCCCAHTVCSAAVTVAHASRHGGCAHGSPWMHPVRTTPRPGPSARCRPPGRPWLAASCRAWTRVAWGRGGVGGGARWRGAGGWPRGAGSWAEDCTQLVGM